MSCNASYMYNMSCGNVYSMCSNIINVHCVRWNRTRHQVYVSLFFPLFVSLFQLYGTTDRAIIATCEHACTYSVIKY